MKMRNGIVSAVAGVSMLGGGAAAALLAGGAGSVAPTASLLSAPAAATSPAAAPTAPAPAIAAAPAGPVNTTCSALKDDGAWPDYTNGRPPQLDAGDAAADYIWHDANGWHVRITHQNDHHQVWSGVITTSGTFSDVDAVKLENNDHFKVGPDGHTIEFRFNNYGGVDGIDFKTHCSEGIHFALRADGARVNPTEVIIGHGDISPADVPFTIHRTEGEKAPQS